MMEAAEVQREEAAGNDRPSHVGRRYLRDAPCWRRTLVVVNLHRALTKAVNENAARKSGLSRRSTNFKNNPYHGREAVVDFRT
jgi:hypothetical protein